MQHGTNSNRTRDSGRTRIQGFLFQWVSKIGDEDLLHAFLKHVDELSERPGITDDFSTGATTELLAKAEIIFIYGSADWESGNWICKVECKRWTKGVGGNHGGRDKNGLYLTRANLHKGVTFSVLH